MCGHKLGLISQAFQHLLSSSLLALSLTSSLVWMERLLGACMPLPLLLAVALRDPGNDSIQLHVRAEGQSGYPLKDEITLGVLLRLLCPGIEICLSVAEIGQGQVCGFIVVGACSPSPPARLQLQDSSGSGLS